MFITFEGIDFSGKSTQCDLLEKYLRGLGREVVRIREPGGTAISEKIRALLLDKENRGMTGLTEFLLYSASRAQLVNEVIKPALAEGKTVLCDRYADSSTAYQGFARNIGIEEVEKINRLATGGLVADLTVYVDITVEEAIRRLAAQNKTGDRIENEGREFFERVRRGYLHIATTNKDRFKVVNGMDDINNIQEKIRAIVKEKFGI